MCLIAKSCVVDKSAIVKLQYSLGAMTQGNDIYLTSNIMQILKHLIQIVHFRVDFYSLAGGKMRLGLFVCYMISMGILFI